MKTVTFELATNSKWDYLASKVSLQVLLSDQCYHNQPGSISVIHLSISMSLNQPTRIYIWQEMWNNKWLTKFGHPLSSIVSSWSSFLFEKTWNDLQS